MKTRQKNYRSSMILIFTILLFTLIISYIKIIHMPYLNEQNRLTKIRDEIIIKNDLAYDDYFYEHIRGSTTYVIAIIEDGKKIYQAYNQNNQQLDQFDQKIHPKKDIIKQFKDKYGFEPTNISITYYQNRFVYFVQNKQNDRIIYSYYQLSDGIFVESNQL